MSENIQPKEMAAATIVEKLPYSISLVADAIGVTPTFLSKVINRKATSRRCANYIAKLLKKNIAEVFGDKYESKEILKGSSRDEKINEIKLLLTKEEEKKQAK